MPDGFGSDTSSRRPGDRALARRLSAALEGEVLFDAFSRGRYSTDASIYQIEPIGVVVPKHAEDVQRTIEIARDVGVPVLPRGGGTSQCGQTVGEAIVVDVSRHMDKVLDFDPEKRRVTVQPGLVLERLNAFLKPQGLFYPVDVSTANRATLGGMAGNNSCGARSLAYGTMRDNVHAIEAVLADGAAAQFGPLSNGNGGAHLAPEQKALVETLLALGRREANEIAARFPKLMRRVGGYNIDALAGNEPINLSHLLVGSEGTLAFSTAIELNLQPLPAHKVLGVCHFPSFYEAMDSARHIVALNPTAVELVDRTMIDLARDIPMFRSTVERFVKGEPAAILLVEYAGDDRTEQLQGLARLNELMGSLGFPDHLVEAVDPAFQSAIWEVRKAGLNIMMSMKGDGKPVSFIEDCAVALEDLADYTDRLTQVFHKYGTEGTWYAHASVGCLHVRPILNMKDPEDVKKMRAIAEEAFAMVRAYKGSHSGEHGDGLVRSEFHEAMFGSRMVRNFEEVKDRLDPSGLFNPGKIVRPPKMDDRSLFRYKPEYRTEDLNTALDWSEWGGFAGAVEMCNNNGACRKRDAAVMCPSFRATGEEMHVTRGRANTLRLALSGQLGPDALNAPEMAETMKLCVGCKACKRECPTGVDMARMKIEVLHHQRRHQGLSLHDRLVGYLPRYAPTAARFGPLLGLRDTVPGLAAASEAITGFSAKRCLPTWARRPFREPAQKSTPVGDRSVVLLPDCFNRYFEPENLEAALKVLESADIAVHFAQPQEGTRPLCCGRTFLSVGLVEEARVEARRMLAALSPFVAEGVPILGLEPSCLLTLRDELTVVLPGKDSDAVSRNAWLFEEYLAQQHNAGRLALPLGQAEMPRRAWLHGHCHQKSFDAFASVGEVLALVPDLEVKTIASSCCGMAGAFGYGRETYDMSQRMANLSLLPALVQADPEDIILADGFSCRHQIADGAGRPALHVARLLAAALESTSEEHHIG